MAKSRSEKAYKARMKAATAEFAEGLRALPVHDLENLRRELGREAHAQSQILGHINARRDAIDEEISRRRTLTSSGFHISDHAVLRYLERHRGMDIQAVRDEIGAIAERARRAERGDGKDGVACYGRRHDAETGLVLGVNEDIRQITTVFSRPESETFDSATEAKPPVRP